MKKIYSTSIFLSFIGLWITSYLSGLIEIILGFILIFSFGILHGSNDVLLIHTISKQKYSFIRVILTYICTVLLAVITFYFLPLLALAFFIIFSAFHFGEQHYEHNQLNLPKWLLNTFYITYGMLVLQTLFVLNIDDVISIVNSIANYTIIPNEIEKTFVLTLFIFILITSIILLTSKSFRSIAVMELFYLIIFAIIFKVSTLIWGFTIYFIFWHSLPSLFEQISFLYDDFNKNTILKYCKKAFPYWILSLIGVGIVFYIFRNDEMFYAIFFSFIAAITFPHALVINKMFYKKKSSV